MSAVELSNNDLRRIAAEVGMVSSHDRVTMRSIGHAGGMTADDGFAFARAAIVANDRLRAANRPSTDISAPEALVDPMLLYYREWWGLQTLRGDPARREHLVRDAYLSGAAQGALLARTTVAMIRAPATSGWLQTLPVPGPATLQWEDEPKVVQATPALLEGMQSLPCAVMDDWLYVPHADGNWVSAAKLQPFSLEVIRYWRAEQLATPAAPVDKSADLHGSWTCARDTGPRCATPCGLVMCGPGKDSVVDAEFPGRPTIAECIAQLDVWNGHLEAAIDREAHEKLGQPANDEPPAGGRDPMEQFP